MLPFIYKGNIMKKSLLAFITLLAVTCSASEKEIQQYNADARLLHTFHDSYISTEAADVLNAFYKAELKQLKKGSFSKLNRHDQIDRILLRSSIEQDQLALRHEQIQLMQDKPFLPFLETTLKLELSLQKMAPIQEAEAAQSISAFLEELKSVKKALEKQKKNKTKSEDKGDDDDAPKEETSDKKSSDDKDAIILPEMKAAQAMRVAYRTANCRKSLEHWYKHYAAYRPGFEWWMKTPWENAKKQLEEYEKFLKEKIAEHKDKDGPLIGEPVGRERLTELIRGEFLPYTPEELLAIGEKEFAWCEQQAEKAASKMGADNRLAGLELIKSKHVPPGQQDALVADYAQQAIDFLDKRKLLTIPDLCREFWTISMIDPKQQQNIPYAMYSGNKVHVAFAAGSMEQDKKDMSMRGNNLHTTRIVTAHELIPGHHLQRFYGARNRPYRGTFSTSFFVEGWPLYWEIRLWDLDYARNEEDKMGMLFWRMHRCARIIVTLKFHLGQMTPEEMVTFLVKEVGHEDEQARAEVRRFIGPHIPPLYQCGYMIGGLQLNALQQSLVKSKMSEQAFHDKVLTLGPIPVELIRASFTDQKLTLDYQPQWKFYELNN